MDTLLSFSPDNLLFAEIKKQINKIDSNEYYTYEDEAKKLSKQGLLAVFFIVLLGFLELFMKVYAVYLCWNINSRESIPLRILYTVFAYWFGLFYVVYYKIAH